MSANVRYGFKGKLYFNSGSYNSPTWNEVSAISDCMVNADFDEQDATTRAGGGLKESEPTLLALSITGKIREDEDDTTGFIALETAFLARAAIDVMVLNGPSTTNGVRGYRFDAKCFKFGEDQGLAAIKMREFELKKCISANAAKKAVVAAGAPVFTTLAA